MYSKTLLILLMLVLFSGLLLCDNVLKIDKLVVKSISIDSARGLSFKNMIIKFNERKDAKDIIMSTFTDPKYKFSECDPIPEKQGCIHIIDSSYESNKSTGEKDEK